ncbi:MAG: YihY/virulence factor BrkB family protein [Nitrospirota bacterium]
MWGSINDVIVRFLWEKDLSSYSRHGVFAVKLLRLLYVALQEISGGQLTLRAMSLVYTTLLSLAPLIAVSFSVLKAFGAHHQVRPLLLNFFEPIGPKGEELTNRIIGFVENINVGVLGTIGLVTLIYTVVTMIQKVEESFNYIWKVNRPRGFLRRFSDYLSVLLIGPVLIFSAMGITASIMSTHVVQKIISLEPFGTAVYIAGAIIPYFIVCAAFTFIYIFIPNVKVQLRSALTGGVFAGILWEASGWAFASFVATSTRYPAIYSGFAIVILFMMWIYLSWLILLTGAAVSFYHQYPQLITPRREPFIVSSRLRERISLLIMFHIGYHFYHNLPPWTLDGLMRHIRLPFQPILEILTLLKGKSLVFETGDDPPLYLPARDIETIPLKEILDAVRTAGEGSYHPSGECISESEIERTLKRIDEAISGALGESTLKSVVLACKSMNQKQM